MMIIIIVNIILEISIVSSQSSQSSQSCDMSSYSEIKSLMNGKCLDNDGSAFAPNVQMYDCNGENSQKWYYDETTNEIKNINLNRNDLCLDVAGGNTADGTNIRMWGCNNHQAQKWILNADGTISNINGGCLDISGGNNNNGANVHIFTCNGNQERQQWMLISEIKSVINGKCLDVEGGSTDPNANIRMWPCNGYNAQKWYYNKLTKEIKNFNADSSKDDLCLDLKDGSIALGTNIRTWPCNGHNAQKWSLNADGTISNIIGGCLNIFNSNVNTGANVEIFTCNAQQSNQLWFGTFMPKKPDNYFQQRAYSLPGCNGYRSLVTYIPINGESYDQAKLLEYEWCLSIGLIDGNRGNHQIADHEHNLYWCDNNPSSNQDCKCLGFKVVNNVYWFRINGIAYRLIHGGNGNEIQTCESNLKADMNGQNGGYYFWYWSSDTLHRSGAYIQWDADQELFRDMIDGNNKNGREAKVQIGNPYTWGCNIFGLNCRTSCRNPGYGDKMEWK